MCRGGDAVHDVLAVLRPWLHPDGGDLDLVRMRWLDHNCSLGSRDAGYGTTGYGFGMANQAESSSVGSLHVPGSAGSAAGWGPGGSSIPPCAGETFGAFAPSFGQRWIPAVAGQTVSWCRETAPAVGYSCRGRESEVMRRRLYHRDGGSLPWQGSSRMSASLWGRWYHAPAPEGTPTGQGGPRALGQRERGRWRLTPGPWGMPLGKDPRAGTILQGAGEH